MKNIKKIAMTVAVVALVAVMAVAMVGCSKYTTLDAQADILKELNAKTADVGIMDFTMANYLLSTDTAMANELMIADIDFEKEYYGIAFRKGADGKLNALTYLVNTAMKALEDTKYQEIAAEYGIQDATLELATPQALTQDDIDMTDFNKVVENGKVVIGFTLNAPMALGEGEQTTGGFDTDFSKEVFALISSMVEEEIAVEFKLISWGNKEAEMEAGTIDCIWNGMTVTDERAAMWDITNNYLTNRQCAVIRKADKDLYTTKESLKDAKIVVEGGSAGEDAAKAIYGITE